MGDQEEGSSIMGQLGSKLGKGASKAGKKAAQSEAGRRATKAAVKGACDGVKDDMTARYCSDPSSTTSSSNPAPASTSVGTTESEREAPVPSWQQDDYNDQYGGGSSTASRSPVKRTTAPPKPSFFDRLNFTKKDKKRARPRVDPKDRIYKSRLAKAADWDKLPLAQALYHFQGEMKCDLVFRKGQVIQIITLTETQNDWWEGRVDGRVGIFPANYVKLM